MIVNNIFSWQKSTWSGLLAKTDSLPHALLLIGPAGIGKGLFADALAARLLCETAQAGQSACGHCDGCRLIASDNHPDLRKVTLEEADDEEGEDAPAPKSRAKKKTAPSTQIRIDQIRALEDFVFVGSHRQGRRVVVIDPADAMNVAATNSLLKILEEPPASVYFILVSSNPKRLLPTLRSRCRQMPFGLPDTAAAIAWLKSAGLPRPELQLALAGGAPLKALALGQEGGADIIDEAIGPLGRQPLEPLALAAHWDAVRVRNPAFLLEHLVDAVQKWLYDLNRVRNGCAPRFLIDRHKELAGVAAKTSPARLNRCHADLLRIRASARHPLNERLFLEDMAARCAAALR